MTTTRTIDPRGIEQDALWHGHDAEDALKGSIGGTATAVAGAVSDASPEFDRSSKKGPRVQRGLTMEVSSTQLRVAIWTRALRLADRFRVIRTVDVAVKCFPERDYKAALTAAQRAMRGLVKASLLRRYRTDRFQTVYGLTQAGVRWLQDADIEAAASVRRVCDMTNPEHRLWSQFLVLAAEARGLQSWTEPELMQLLNRDVQGSKLAVHGLLRVAVATAKGTATKFLRPDALFAETDGATWVEVDRSARGSDRGADLRALVLSVGADLADRRILRRVVVFARTDRIRRRLVASLTLTVHHTREGALACGRRQLRHVGDGLYEVWLTSDQKHRDGRVSLVDRLAGHVVVQLLPVWLPKLRLDGRGTNSTAGWMSENYLPYRRPSCMQSWTRPASPLLGVSGSSLVRP